ncbi:MAG: type II toxin-antitoxin system prevent-host-death family antitoxin, partial [Alphaproteobacteria bacterium]|nr:type II toxin-antitoxin system prevent-host-death family antitoxin [Alphaproteobacteria bacterium]
VIAKAGKPLVKVTSVNSPTTAQVRRLGFLCGEIEVPEDFDRMGEAEIERLFSSAT